MLSRATVAVKYVDLVKRIAPRAKLVFDTVDLHFLRQQRLAELNPEPSLIAAANPPRPAPTIIACAVVFAVNIGQHSKLLNQMTQEFSFYSCNDL